MAGAQFGVVVGLGIYLRVGDVVALGIRVLVARRPDARQLVEQVVVFRRGTLGRGTGFFARGVAMPAATATTATAAAALFAPFGRRGTFRLFVVSQCGRGALNIVEIFLDRLPGLAELDLQKVRGFVARLFASGGLSVFAQPTSTAAPPTPAPSAALTVLAWASFAMPRGAAFFRSDRQLVQIFQ